MQNDPIDQTRVFPRKRYCYGDTSVEEIKLSCSRLDFSITTPTPGAYHFVVVPGSSADVSSMAIASSYAPAGTLTLTPTRTTLAVSSTIGIRSSGLNTSPTSGLAGMNTVGLLSLAVVGGSDGRVGPPTSQLPSLSTTSPSS